MKPAKLMKRFLSRLKEVGWLYILGETLGDNYPDLLVIKNRGNSFWVNFTNKKKWSNEQKAFYAHIKKHNHPGYILKNKIQVDACLKKILPISYERAHELLEHREDGHLYRNNKRWGRLVNKDNDHFIIVGGIEGRIYRAHQLIWFMHTGIWGDIIDHINNDPLDNRIENLRNVDVKGNAQNHKKARKNISKLHNNIIAFKSK